MFWACSAILCCIVCVCLYVHVSMRTCVCIQLYLCHLTFYTTYKSGLQHFLLYEYSRVRIFILLHTLQMSHTISNETGSCTLAALCQFHVLMYRLYRMRHICPTLWRHYLTPYINPTHWVCTTISACCEETGWSHPHIPINAQWTGRAIIQGE